MASSGRRGIGSQLCVNLFVILKKNKNRERNEHDVNIMIDINIVSIVSLASNSWWGGSIFKIEKPLRILNWWILHGARVTVYTAPAAPAAPAAATQLVPTTTTIINHLWWSAITIARRPRPCCRTGYCIHSTTNLFTMICNTPCITGTHTHRMVRAMLMLLTWRCQQ